jgi:hypothetical protein
VAHGYEDEMTDAAGFEYMAGPPVEALSDEPPLRVQVSRLRHQVAVLERDRVEIMKRVMALEGIVGE